MRKPNCLKPSYAALFFSLSGNSMSATNKIAPSFKPSRMARFQMAKSEHNQKSLRRVPAHIIPEKTVFSLVTEERSASDYFIMAQGDIMFPALAQSKAARPFIKIKTIGSY